MVNYNSLDFCFNSPSTQAHKFTLYLFKDKLLLFIALVESNLVQELSEKALEKFLFPRDQT